MADNNKFFAVLELVDEEEGYVQIWALNTLFTERSKAIKALEGVCNLDRHAHMYDDGEVIREPYAVVPVEIDRDIMAYPVEPKHWNEIRLERERKARNMKLVEAGYAKMWAIFNWDAQFGWLCVDDIFDNENDAKASVINAVKNRIYWSADTEDDDILTKTAKDACDKAVTHEFNECEYPETCIVTQYGVYIISCGVPEHFTNNKLHEMGLGE